jgi:hypothetical protein
VLEIKTRASYMLASALLELYRSYTPGLEKIKFNLFLTMKWVKL